MSIHYLKINIVDILVFNLIPYHRSLLEMIMWEESNNFLDAYTTVMVKDLRILYFKIGKHPILSKQKKRAKLIIPQGVYNTLSVVTQTKRHKGNKLPAYNECSLDGYDAKALSFWQKIKHDLKPKKNNF